MGCIEEEKKGSEKIEDHNGNEDNETIPDEDNITDEINNIITENITKNTIWPKQNESYFIKKRIFVLNNATLTINAGVIVKFDENCGLYVENGTLIAKGRENQRIIFTSNQSNPHRQDWKSITIQDNNKLHFCDIFYSEYGILIGENNEIINCNFSNNRVWGVQCEMMHNSNSNFIENSTFSYNGQGGIQLHGGNENIIINCTFIKNGEYGVSMHNSDNNLIENCKLSFNPAGIIIGACSCGLSYYNIIDQCEISNNHLGISIHGTIGNIITYSTISNNEYGVNLTAGWSDYFQTKNNHIHHNNFISNQNQIGNHCDNNSWDDGDGHGNFWSDYNGTDINKDGIGDTNVPWLGVDNYPLIEKVSK